MDDRVYRAVVQPSQRVELLLDALGLRRRVSPPALYKRRLLAAYARSLGVRLFIETGTYLGDTAFELAGVVDRVVTIELDAELAERARRRLVDPPTVTVLQGDSGQVLRGLMPDLREPALFWLDAHYSGHITARGRDESPIGDELAAILAHWIPGSAVLIDDANCFVGRAGYLSRQTLRRFVRERRPELEMIVERNIIRFVPSQLSGEPERARRRLRPVLKRAAT